MSNLRQLAQLQDSGEFTQQHNQRVQQQPQQGTGYDQGGYPRMPGSASSLRPPPSPLPAQKDSITSQMSGVDKKVEAEIEAERLWWSEVSERQVKELESSFGVEFQKTTDKLRTDINRMQDRLEMLVETEKSQRQASMDSLRRDIDAQQVAATEVVREVMELKKTIEAGVSFKGPAGALDPKDLSELAKSTSENMAKTMDLVTRLQSDLEASRTMMNSNHASLRTEWENHKINTQSSEVSISDLRRELQSSQEHQELHMTQVKDLRRDLTSLTERMHLQANSNDEVHALHQVIMQSAGDLSCGIEEVSAAVLATEHKLRQEMDAMKATLEASFSKQRLESLEALDQTSKTFEQRIFDEAEKRGLEANVLSKRIEAVTGSLDDTMASVKASQPTQPTAQASEVIRLQTLLDTTKADLGRLESTLAEDRSTALSAVQQSRRLQEDNAKMINERVAKLEISSAEERSSRMSDIADMRRYTEDIVSKRMGEAVLQAETMVRGRDGDQEVVSPEVKMEVRNLKIDVESVKAILQDLHEEGRRTASLAARTEAELHVLEADSRKVATIASRVETVIGNTERLEAEVRQAVAASGVADLKSLEEEVRKGLSALGAFASRMDSNEAEMRKAAREVYPLVARLDATESELQRVVRDNLPLIAKIESVNSRVETIRSEVKEVANRLLEVNSKVDKAGSQLRQGSPSRGQNLALASRSGVLSGQPGGMRPARERSGSRPKEATTPGGGGLPVPGLSDELKNSIENLVQKVNKTISKNDEETPSAMRQPVMLGQPKDPEAMQSKPPQRSVELSAKSSMAQALPSGAIPGRGRVDLNSLQQMVDRKTNQAAMNAQRAGGVQDALDDTGRATPNIAMQQERPSISGALNNPAASPEGFMQALQAVQELRERNLCLREENAELVEELLTTDGLISPPQGGQYSQGPSASATPTTAVPNSAQLLQGLYGRSGSPDPALANRQNAGQRNSVRRPMSPLGIQGQSLSHTAPIGRLQGGMSLPNTSDRIALSSTSGSVSIPNATTSMSGAAAMQFPGRQSLPGGAVSPQLGKAAGPGVTLQQFARR